MVNFKYNPNELGIKNVWWGKEEKYWIEISNKDKNEEHKKYRGDFGSDLRAPTKDWSGNRNVSMYSICLLYTSPSPRDAHESRMPSSA